MNCHTRSFWKLFSAGPPAMLALLLGGCIGHNALVFPWSKTEDSRLEHVTEATFDDRVLKCDRPVLVDFYAEWCGPCKRLTPLVEDFAQQHPEFRVVKVDVDQNRELAHRYQVNAMPTLLAIRGGRVTQRSVGLIPKEGLSQLMAMPAAVAESDSQGISHAAP